MIVLSVGTSGQGALRFHIRFSWGLPVIDAGEARKVPYRRVEEHMQRRSPYYGSVCAGNAKRRLGRWHLSGRLFPIVKRLAFSTEL